MTNDEILMTKEVRMTKSEPRPASEFGFRISSFFRHWCFVIRHSVSCMSWFALLLCVGCNFAPKYTKPPVPAPAAFKELTPEQRKETDGWKRRNRRTKRCGRTGPRCSMM